jgi:hypothetical protein
MERVLPWGLKLPIIYQVPQIVPGTNKLSILRNQHSGKPLIKRDPRADTFKEHLKAGTLQILSAARSLPPFANVQFPLDGAQCQIRVDVLMAFSLEGTGPQRLKTSDLDNLKKSIFDALSGTLIDDDRFITEGYTAKGSGFPGDPNDRICLIVSRAGYRDSAALDWLGNSLPLLPPWRPQDQGAIILARPGDLKNMH